jgi:prepilin-type N-terminal cleavage/methylation domain-containing protein
MKRSVLRPTPRSERGASLVELLVALVVLAIGVLGVAQLFPAGARGQTRDRMRTVGNNYAQDKIEELSARSWLDAELSLGRHPGGTATEALGTTGAWKRFYEVESMTAPMDNLRKVTVTVAWSVSRPETVRATTYVRR